MGRESIFFTTCDGATKTASQPASSPLPNSFVFRVWVQNLQPLFITMEGLTLWLLFPYSPRASFQPTDNVPVAASGPVAAACPPPGSCGSLPRCSASPGRTASHSQQRQRSHWPAVQQQCVVRKRTGSNDRDARTTRRLSFILCFHHLHALLMSNTDAF